MAHIPFGYKIENGKAVVDQSEADKLSFLYKAYLSGKSLSDSAKSADLRMLHPTIKNLLTNKHYLGDEFYPPLIGLEIYEGVQAELLRRATKLGRLNHQHKCKAIIIPTKFHLSRGFKTFDDPIKQAEYLYSLIEREEY